MEDQQPNLYLIRVTDKKGNVLVKLGYTSNIDERMRTYYYHNPLIEVIETFYKQDAKEFEKAFHKAVPSELLYEWYSEDKLPLIIDAITTGKIPNLGKENVKPQFSMSIEAIQQITTLLDSKALSIFMKLVAIAVENKLYVPDIDIAYSYRKASVILGADRRILAEKLDSLKALNLIKMVKGMLAINPSVITIECDTNIKEAFAETI